MPPTLPGDDFLSFSSSNEVEGTVAGLAIGSVTWLARIGCFGEENDMPGMQIEHYGNVKDRVQFEWTGAPKEKEFPGYAIVFLFDFAVDR